MPQLSSVSDTQRDFKSLKLWDCLYLSGIVGSGGMVSIECEDVVRQNGSPRCRAGTRELKKAVKVHRIILRLCILLFGRQNSKLLRSRSKHSLNCLLFSPSTDQFIQC